jgi:hypothetical protein
MEADAARGHCDRADAGIEAEPILTDNFQFHRSVMWADVVCASASVGNNTWEASIRLDETRDRTAAQAELRKMYEAWLNELGDLPIR